MQQFYYISSGATNALFTLRLVTQSDRHYRDSYIRNLGNNEEECRQKAKEIAESRGIEFRDGHVPDLRQIRQGVKAWELPLLRMLEQDVMPWGKYKGKNLSDIQNEDEQYLLWMFDKTADAARLTEQNLHDKLADMLHDAIEQRAAEFLERERQRAAEHAAAAECPVGRIEIQGEILSLKIKHGYYGECLKMLIKHESGFKVWGTAPKAIAENVERGDVVKFTATVEQSDDDNKFGFFKRPSKAQIIKQAA